MGNTNFQEIILTRIKLHVPKENKLIIEKNNKREYIFENKIIKLDNYLKTIKISNSSKVSYRFYKELNIWVYRLCVIMVF